MSKQMEILKFRSSPRGYYYGGEEHFKEEVTKFYIESYTKAALDVGHELPEGSALLPVVVHMLLDDNTGLMAMQFPENKQQKDAIADAIRAFIGDHQKVLKDSLNIDGKIVAIAICMEMWFRAIDVKGLSEEEINKAINDRMKNQQLIPVSGISVDIQFPDASKNTVQMFKTNPTTGEVTPYKNAAVATNLGKDLIWGEMFTRKLENAENQEGFLSPKSAEEFVSKTIKHALQANSELGRKRELTPEEKGIWSTTFGTEPNIDISDLFKPGTSTEDKQ